VQLKIVTWLFLPAHVRAANDKFDQNGWINAIYVCISNKKFKSDAANASNELSTIYNA
jgi:hypothetical protein